MNGTLVQANGAAKARKAKPTKAKAKAKSAGAKAERTGTKAERAMNGRILNLLKGIEADAPEKPEGRKQKVIGMALGGRPVPTADMEIPNRKEAERKLAEFLELTGIQPISPPSPVPLDDGNVFWTFVGRLGPAAFRRIIKHYNAHNRLTGWSGSAQYALSMQHGKWRFTGEPLLFSRDYELQDGQNRIMAGLAVGATLDFVVGFGLPPTTIRTIGRPLVRTNAHQHQAEGRHYPGVRAPLVAMLHRFERSTTERDLLEQNGEGSRCDGNRDGELDAHYKAEIDAALEFIHGLRWGIGNALPPRIAAFLYMLMARKSEQAAGYFMQGLADGRHAHPGTPLAAVRERLLKFKRDKHDARVAHINKMMGKASNGGAALARGSDAMILRLVALAWNSFCAGKKNTSGSFKVDTSVTTSEILRALAEPCAKALKEAEAFDAETRNAVLARARARREADERKQSEKLRDEGDVKLSKIKSFVETY